MSMMITMMMMIMIMGMIMDTRQKHHRHASVQLFQHSALHGICTTLNKTKNNDIDGEDGHSYDLNSADDRKLSSSSLCLSSSSPLI